MNSLRGKWNIMPPPIWVGTRPPNALHDLLEKAKPASVGGLLEDLSSHQVNDPHYRIDLAWVGVFFRLPNDAGKHIASLGRELLVLLDPELTLEDVTDHVVLHYVG